MSFLQSTQFDSLTTIPADLPNRRRSGGPAFSMPADLYSGGAAWSGGPDQQQPYGGAAVVAEYVGRSSSGSRMSASPFRGFGGAADAESGDRSAAVAGDQLIRFASALSAMAAVVAD